MPQRVPRQTLHHRLWPILLFACGVTLGCYALRLELRSYTPLEVSPDGTKLLLAEWVGTSRYQRGWYYVLDLESNQIVCDLSKFGRPKFPSWRWSADSKSVYGVFQDDFPQSEPAELLQIDVSNSDPRIVQRQTLDAFDIEAAKLLDDGTVAYVSRHPATMNDGKSANRPHLRFVIGGKEVGRIEHGRNESAGVLFYDDDASLVRVMVHPSTAKGMAGDYAISDGTNPELLQFEFATARELFRTTAKYQNGPPLFHGSNAAVSLVNGKRRLVTAGREADSGESSKMIMNLLPDEDVIVANDNRVVTVDRPHSSRLISIHGPTGGTPQTAANIFVVYALKVLPDREAENLIYSTAVSGRLMKLNLDTQQVEQLLTARPWQRAAGWLALAGWLAFPVIWFTRARSLERPLLDCGILLMVLLVGSLISLHFAVPPVTIWRGLRCLTLAIAFSMVSIYFLVWNDSAQRKWISVMLIAAAAASLFYRDNMIADLLLGGFWAYWHLCGTVALSALGGRSAKVPSGDSSSANKFSLRQIIVATGVIAGLLAAMRFYVAGSGGSNQTAQQQIVWLLYAPFATAVITVVTSNAAFKIRSVWLSVVAGVAVIVAMLALVFGIAGINLLTVDANHLEWCAVTILTALLLFVIYRQLRNQSQRSGINFQRSTARQETTRN